MEATYNDKQVHILRTAEKLFADKGYDGTSVRDIAEEADVNLAMISYYFGSKLKLMEALFEQRSLYIRMRVEDLLKDTKTEPLERMYTLIDEYLDRMVEKQRFVKIMLCEQVVNKNPVIINLINEVRLKNAEAITKLIKDGQKRGFFKKNVDVVLLTSTLIGTVSQLMISLEHYKNYNKLQALNKDNFQTLVFKKLRSHIKRIFKSLLTDEA